MLRNWWDILVAQPSSVYLDGLHRNLHEEKTFLYYIFLFAWFNSNEVIRCTIAGCGALLGVCYWINEYSNANKSSNIFNLIVRCEHLLRDWFYGEWFITRCICNAYRPIMLGKKMVLNQSYSLDGTMPFESKLVVKRCNDLFLLQRWSFATVEFIWKMHGFFEIFIFFILSFL